MSKTVQAQVVVLGGGPAGYSAAFRCADLGLKTVIIEKRNTLGGVCLNVGCIPSKALLHMAALIEGVHELNSLGVDVKLPKAKPEPFRAWKNKVVKQLTDGLAGMSKMRKVDIIQGEGKMVDDHNFVVTTDSGEVKVSFESAILAPGSRPVELPFIPHEDPRIWDSTDALEINEIPKKLLIMGGGIIGLEMGTVYHALGSEIEVVEMLDQIIPAADADIAKFFTKAVSKKFKIMTSTKVLAVDAKKDGIHVTMESAAGTTSERYDAVLVAIGRKPNGSLFGAEAFVTVDERGFIPVDSQQRTNKPHIYAIGDVTGQPMLAHKGVHEGHVAAEVIAGKNHHFDAQTIPSIAYTEPEVAWAGKTEKECKEQNIPYETAIFPWAASGRALASNASEGLTKLIFNKETNELLGGAIVGVNAGELLGEVGLAVEMHADAEDIALSVHAHPTLYESIGLAAEIYEGSITDLPNKKAKK